MFYEVWHSEKGAESGIAQSGRGKMAWCTSGVENDKVHTGCGGWRLEHGRWEMSIMTRWTVDRKQCMDSGYSILIADNGEQSMGHKYGE